MKCPSNLLSPVLAVLAACASPAVVMGADDPQAKKTVGDAASTERPPMIVPNPDGTFTAQKNAAKGTAQKGLVIPIKAFDEKLAKLGYDGDHASKRSHHKNDGDKKPE